MSSNPQSTAKIGAHPLHPMLIPFPVAFLVGAFVTDLVFLGTADGFWARASIWLIGAGIVMALLAALAGFTDFFSEPRIRGLSDAWYHMVGNLTAVIIAVINFAVRYSEGTEGAIKGLGRGAIAGRRRDPALHRLEGLGNGLPPSGCGFGGARISRAADIA